MSAALPRVGNVYRVCVAAWCPQLRTFSGQLPTIMQKHVPQGATLSTRCVGGKKQTKRALATKCRKNPVSFCGHRSEGEAIDKKRHRLGTACIVNRKRNRGLRARGLARRRFRKTHIIAWKGIGLLKRGLQ